MDTRLELRNGKTARGYMFVCCLCNSAVCASVFIAHVCITCVGFLHVLFSLCVCVQTCALISFYWHCCVTCWNIMWDDLFLPLSSRCSQRYPTCFKTPPVTSWRISRKERLYYLQLFTGVIYLMYLFSFHLVYEQKHSEGNIRFGNAFLPRYKHLLCLLWVGVFFMMPLHVQNRS